jgi:hypothetical protein
MPRNIRGHHQRLKETRKSWALVAHTYKPSYSGGEASPGKTVCKTLSQKYPTQKKSSQRGSSSVAPASKHEALSSNPSTTLFPQKKEGLSPRIFGECGLASTLILETPRKIRTK